MSGREEIDKKFLNCIDNKLKNSHEFLKNYYYSKNLSPRTMSTYIYIIKKFVDNLNKEVSEVSIDDINEYIFRMKDCSSSHKATTYSALKSFF